MAIPQYAMPHVGSFSAIAAKVSLAFSYQKEWSIATALPNCGCTDGSQDTGNMTFPSFVGSPAGCSCWATAGETRDVYTLHRTTRRDAIRFMLASVIAQQALRNEVLREPELLTLILGLLLHWCQADRWRIVNRLAAWIGRWWRPQKLPR